MCFSCAIRSWEVLLEGHWSRAGRSKGGEVVPSGRRPRARECTIQHRDFLRHRRWSRAGRSRGESDAVVPSSRRTRPCESAGSAPSFSSRAVMILLHRTWSHKVTAERWRRRRLAADQQGHRCSTPWGCAAKPALELELELVRAQNLGWSDSSLTNSGKEHVPASTSVLALIQYPYKQGQSFTPDCHGRDLVYSGYVHR
jgi:hypothetical protein